MVIVICAHVVKVYNNCASTLIIYKVNIFIFTYYLFSIKKYDKVIKRIHFFWWKIPKVFINYVRTVFFKKQQVMWHLFCIDRFEMKNLHLLLFFAGDSCLLSLCMLLWTNFPYKGGHSIAHLIFLTCVQWSKDHFGLFWDTNTQSCMGDLGGSDTCPFSI